MHRIKANRKRYIRLIIPMLCLLGLFMPSKAMAQKKSFTVVLDAGHGGHDAGAVKNGVREKDINLSVALKVGELIKRRHPNVKILYTRKNDRFIPLMQRANYANSNKADLFISIHANSAPTRSARGTETYVFGMSSSSKNLNVAKRENGVITLEKNHKTTYQGFDPNSTESYIMFELMQNAFIGQSIQLGDHVQREFSNLGRGDRGVRQMPLLVLVYSAMPSVLIELGFISNTDEARFLGSQSGQNKLANAIAKGFSRYKDNYDRRNGIAITPRNEADEYLLDETETTSKSSGGTEAPSNETESGNVEADTEKASKETSESNEKERIYRVQIMASSSKLKENDRQFKGESIYINRKGKLYCYSVGKTKSLAEAKKLQRKLKEKFSGAFIVAYENGERVDQIY